MIVFTVKPGLETTAIREAVENGFYAKQCGSGLICTQNNGFDTTDNLCFPSWQLMNPEELSLKNIKPVVCVDEWFRNVIRNESIIAPWLLIWLVSSDNGYIPDLRKAHLLCDVMKKRISRIVKLASLDIPEAGTLLNGLFVAENQAGSLWISRHALFYGQRRMKDDPAAPSRSYLKIEEAFSVCNRYPQQGEKVVDLGAAPGGWSWSAAKRGAYVLAIDNGPLKKGAAADPRIKHIRADAFTWRPDVPVDWLLCDMVDDPSRVLGLVRQWFENRWCRFGIINFKYGHADPLFVLKNARGPKGLAPFAKRMLCRHLYHDREEITLMAEAK